MSIFLDDSKSREQLQPFTFTRAVADIRIGILTIKEKWELLTGEPVYTAETDKKEDSIVVNAQIIPTKDTADQILKAAKDRTHLLETEEIKMLHYPWHIFEYNNWALRKDFELVTANRKSNLIPPSNKCISSENIFIEDAARVEYCILNAGTGPIYIGKEVEIMEGSMIRGPFCAGEKSLVKMGAQIYGATTLGPHCVAGGEIKNSVFFGYSNKAHDGYLGDSVIGEWCNLGAGTSNSNIKNTAGQVKYIVNENRDQITVGIKAGLLMGDYSRAAINTSFNTGTIVGVCCNILDRMPGKFVNNFSWGSERYIFEKALADIDRWKQMKGKSLTEAEITLLENLYSTTS